MITIDRDKCIKCGACAGTCITKAIVMTKEGPQEDNDVCIGCGQCVSACPKEAIDNVNAPLAKMVSLKKELEVSPEQARQLLLKRRSVRAFSKRPVEQEKIEAVLDVARHAPSGDNAQGISYVVIRNREVLDRIVKAATEQMKPFAGKGGNRNLVNVMVESYERNGEDRIFYDAPCLILAVCDKPRFTGNYTNGVLCLAYAAVYATTLGLGTCWSGIMEHSLFKDYSAMTEALKGIADPQRICGAIALGYPKYKYRRIPERNPLQINYID